MRNEPLGRTALTDDRSTAAETSPALSLAELMRQVWVEGWSVGDWTGKEWRRLLGVFLLAALCSWIGIMLSRQSEGVATIWLSNGVLFGLLITQPPRRWLPYFIAGLAADTAADVIYGDPFKIAIGVSLANSVEVISSSLLLTFWFGSPLDLSKRRPLVGFLLTSVLGAAAVTSALGASWTMLFVPAGPWWQLFRTWWFGDMLGMAILGPLLVLLQRPAFFAPLHRRNLGHTVLVLLVPVVATVLVFTHETDPLIFFIFPAVLLVAFRLGFPGTVLNILLMSLLAIGLTVKGHGPLMLIVGPHMMLHRIVVAQIFIAVVIFTMFPVAALLEEHEALEASLAAGEAKYRRLAHADELTGLSNRRAFNLRLAEEWEQAQANAHAIALLLIDADFFKQYNDIFGHLSGDECLRSLAEVISATLGSVSAMAARYGGEEFAVLLPGLDVHAARTLAQDICEAVAAQGLQHPSSPAGVQTVSLGVAAMVPGPEQAATELVTLADQALYCAKLSGRNQVACL